MGCLYRPGVTQWHAAPQLTEAIAPGGRRLAWWVWLKRARREAQFIAMCCLRRGYGTAAALRPACIPGGLRRNSRPARGLARVYLGRVSNDHPGGTDERRPK